MGTSLREAPIGVNLFASSKILIAPQKWGQREILQIAG